MAVAISLLGLSVFSTEFTQCRLNLLFPIAAQNRERYLRSWRIARDPIAEGIRVVHGCIVDGGDDVALTDTRAFSSAARPHGMDDDTFGFRHAETLRQIRHHPDNRDTKLTAPDFPIFHELIHDAARHVRGNGKADSNVAAAAG